MLVSDTDTDSNSASPFGNCPSLHHCTSSVHDYCFISALIICPILSYIVTSLDDFFSDYISLILCRSLMIIPDLMDNPPLSPASGMEIDVDEYDRMFED